MEGGAEIGGNRHIGFISFPVEDSGMAFHRFEFLPGKRLRAGRHPFRQVDPFYHRIAQNFEDLFVLPDVPRCRI